MHVSICLAITKVCTWKYGWYIWIYGRLSPDQSKPKYTSPSGTRNVSAFSQRTVTLISPVTSCRSLNTRYSWAPNSYKKKKLIYPLSYKWWGQQRDRVRPGSWIKRLPKPNQVLKMLEARRPQASLHEPQAEKLKSSCMVTRVDKKLGKVVQMCTYIHVHTHTQWTNVQNRHFSKDWISSLWRTSKHH